MDNYVPGPILKAVKEVEEAYNKYKHDEDFLNEFKFYLKNICK